MNGRLSSILTEIGNSNLGSSLDPSDPEGTLRSLPEYLVEVLGEYNSNASSKELRSGLLYAAAVIIEFISVIDGAK